MVQPTEILLQDGISALQQDNDASKTLVYMKLAYQQLSAPSNTASFAVSNNVGPSVTTNPTSLSSSSARSTGGNTVVINVPPKQNRGITPSIRSPSQKPAVEKSAQCDSRCISLAQSAAISLARQNAKTGIVLSLDKINPVTTSSSNTSDHNIEKNNDNSASLWGSNYFQHVTLSHCHTQTEALTDEALTNEASSDKTYANEGIGMFLISSVQQPTCTGGGLTQQTENQNPAGSAPPGQNK